MEMSLNPLQNVLGPFPDEAILSLLDRLLAVLGVGCLQDDVMVCNQIPCPDACPSVVCAKRKPAGNQIRICLSRNNECQKCKCCRCVKKRICPPQCYSCQCLSSSPCEAQTNNREPKCIQCLPITNTPSKKCSSCLEKIVSLLRPKSKCQEMALRSNSPERLQPKPMKSQWALTKVNTFNDNSKTFEIMDMKSLPSSPHGKMNRKMLLAVTGNGTAYVFDSINDNIIEN